MAARSLRLVQLKYVPMSWLECMDGVGAYRADVASDSVPHAGPPVRW